MRRWDSLLSDFSCSLGDRSEVNTCLWSVREMGRRFMVLGVMIFDWSPCLWLKLKSAAFFSSGSLFARRGASLRLELQSFEKSLCKMLCLGFSCVSVGSIAG